MDNRTPPDLPAGHTVRRVLPVPGDVLVLPDELARVPGLFEVALYDRPLGYTFIYFLCQRTGPRAPGWRDTLLLDYVGRSLQVAKRVYDHAKARDREGKREIARLFCIAVPIERARAIEEACIRVMQPMYCNPRGILPHAAPRVREKDVEALRWLGYDVSHISFAE